MTLHGHVGSCLFCSHNVGCYAVVQTAVSRSQHSVATLLQRCFKWLQHCSNIVSVPWFTITLPAGKGIPTLLQVTVGWGKPSAWQVTWKVVLCTSAADYDGILESHHWAIESTANYLNKWEQLIILISFVNLSSNVQVTIFHWCCITNILHFIFAEELCTTKMRVARGRGGGGGVLPNKTLIRTCRGMGSYFHNGIDYNGVVFSIELLEWGRTFSDFLG